jgi:translation initiation factor IF-1
MSDGSVVHGRVLAILPRALYRVGLESGHEVVAHAAEGTAKNFVRLVVGDQVSVQLAAKDAGRGRILRRLSSHGQ